MPLIFGGHTSDAPDILTRLMALRLQDSNRIFQENTAAQHSRDANANTDRSYALSVGNRADSLAQANQFHADQVAHQQQALKQQAQLRDDALAQQDQQHKANQQRLAEAAAQATRDREEQRALQERMAQERMAAAVTKNKEDQIARKERGMTLGAEAVGLPPEIMMRIPDEARGIMPEPHKGGGAFTSRMNFPTPTVEQEIAKTRGKRYEEAQNLKTRRLDDTQDRFDTTLEYKKTKDADSAAERGKKEETRKAEHEKATQDAIEEIKNEASTADNPKDHVIAKIAELTGKLPDNWEQNSVLRKEIARYDRLERERAKDGFYQPRPGESAWEARHKPKDIKQNAAIINGLMAEFGKGGTPDKGNPPPAPMTNPETNPTPAAQSAPPASMLKEGVNSIMSNGQTWTLHNGTPTRVK